MTAELTALTLSALLTAVYFATYSVLAQMQVGTKYAAGPRDEPRQLTGRAGRAQRALTNQFEALILFTIAVLVIAVSDQSTTLTQNAAWTVLAARALYLPSYIYGWTPWRSVIWFVGFFATLAILIAALL